MRVYKQQNVLDAGRERMAWIFDNYDRVVVSISSGKDSTILAHMASREAERRGREVEFFFLDQEAEYQATVAQVRAMMRWSAVKPLWYQVPIRMTNATSYTDCFLHAWEPGAEWIRPKEPDSIHEAPDAPDRFYPFFRWLEQQHQGAAALIGLRAEEVRRYRAVTENPAIPGINWSSRGNGVTKFYPIYDWAFEDIWLYTYREKVEYNKVYDWLWIKGKKIDEFRVSNLIHENSFECLTLLQEMEPDTYNALVRRIGGVAVAARYAKESTLYQTHKKPKAFKTWHAYRDFLLTTIPEEISRVFQSRFAKQLDTEAVHRQQVRQIVTNDYENSRPVKPKKDSDPLAKWREIL
jgi:predicted phosphoadenosine phosphosulfate sulfurtransferase